MVPWSKMRPSTTTISGSLVLSGLKWAKCHNPLWCPGLNYVATLHTGECSGVQG